MKKKKQSEILRRKNLPEILVRVICLAVILFLTGRCAAAEELLPEEEEEQTEKTEVVIVLRPVKEEGEPDPDLSQEIRSRIAEQLSDLKEECLDRLCACVSWEYDYSGGVMPPGTDRPAGESDICLSFSDDPEYAFTGWNGESEQAAAEPETGGVGGSGTEEAAEAGEEGTGQEQTGITGEAGTETEENIPAEDIRERLRSYLTTRPKEKPIDGSEEAGTETTDPEETGAAEADPAEPEPAGPDPEETVITEQVPAEPDPGEPPAEEAAAEEPAAEPVPEPSAGEPEAEAAMPEPPADEPAAEAAMPVFAEPAVPVCPAAAYPMEPICPVPEAAVPEGIPAAEKTLTEMKRTPETAAERKAAESRAADTRTAEVRTEIHLIRTEPDREVDLTDRYREILMENTPERIDWKAVLEPLPENDGMYTLRVTDTDSRGAAVTKDISFSVNRFGSVYMYNSTIQSLRGKIVRNVKTPLVISEYNPDPLEPDSWKLVLTHDGQAVDQVVYTVRRMTEKTDRPETGSISGMEGWYRYDYEIAPENFRKDGVYRLTVSSRDAAGNFPENNRYNGGEIRFTVDSTPPELQEVKGMEQPVVKGKNARIRITAFDAAGLSEAAVYADETCLGRQTKIDDPHRAELTVRVPEGENQKIRIVLTDSAGNRLDTEEKDKNGDYLFRPAFPFQRTLSVIPETGTRTAKREWFALAAAILSCAGAGAWLFQKFRGEGRGSSSDNS